MDEATIIGIVITPNRQVSTVKMMIRLRLLHDRRSAFMRCCKNSTARPNTLHQRSLKDSFDFAMLIMEVLETAGRKRGHFSVHERQLSVLGEGAEYCCGAREQRRGGEAA